MSSPKIEKPVSARRAQTRDRVIAAAREVIGEKGFQRASLDEIAGRAGLTKGAVYSNFQSKEELFLAAVRASGLKLKVDWPANGTARAQMRAVGEACWALLPSAQSQGAFIADFYLYALTNPTVRAAMQAAYEAAFAAAATEVAEQMEKAGHRLSPQALAVTIQALSLGFVFQSLVSPAAVTRETVVAAFEALA